MTTTDLHLVVGWSSMLLGAVSGSVIGLFFHRDDWLGGYESFRRRMLRLGHISLFGLGLLNVAFALTLAATALPPLHTRIASAGFLVGAVAMPLSCFLTAWKKAFRHLFPLPVAGVLAGIVPLLLGWVRR